MAIAHELTSSELIPDGASHLGVLVCACGWGVRVGPYRSQELTEATMNAEWTFHVAAPGPAGRPG